VIMEIFLTDENRPRTNVRRDVAGRIVANCFLVAANREIRVRDPWLGRERLGDQRCERPFQWRRSHLGSGMASQPHEFEEPHDISLR